MERVLGVITARRDSKRLPGKNVKPFRGKPLVAWTIEQALSAECLTRVVLSSDDERVLDLGRTFERLDVSRRPAELARDETPSEDVLRQVLAEVGNDFERVVLLQPTSPLRLSSDIDDAVAIARQTGAKSCISVAPLGKPAPWLMRENAKGRLEPALEAAGGLSSGQLFVPNGAVFVIDTSWLLAGNDFYSRAPAYHLMPAERSIDIDVLQDFVLAEAASTAAPSS